MIWKICSLSDVCSVFNGSTPSRKNKEYWENGSINWFTIEDIRKFGRIINKTTQYVTEKALKETGLKLIPINSVLLCCTASVGEYAITKIPLTMNQQFNALIPNKNELLPEFLFYYCSTIKKKLISASGTTTFDFISAGKLKKIKISYPPLPIQQKIVVKLDKIFAEIDKAIAATEANINNVKMFFENYLNNYFDNNHDLISMPMVDICEELFAGGDVPKDRFSKLKTSKFFIPIFSNGEKNKGLYGFTDKPRVTKPSITISARGTIGYSEVRYEPFYPAIRLIVATPKTELIELDYFKYAIKICKFINSGTSIPQLTIPHIKNYIIKFPQSKEKQKILLKKMINFDLNINQIVFLNSKKLIQLSKLKNSILQQAFNGELVKKAA